MPSFNRLNPRIIHGAAHGKVSEVRDKVLDSHTRFERDITGTKSALQEAMDRFAHAKMDMETRIWGGDSGGAKVELDEAFNEYIDEQIPEIMRNLSAASTPGEIAAATYAAFQVFESNVKTVYKERLDNRHALTKLDAKVGKWLSGGSGRIGSWIRNTGVSSGLSFATGAITGLIGAGTAAGLPITAAFTGTFATVKAGIRREALIELNGESDRGAGIEEADLARFINKRRNSGILDNDTLVGEALEQLSRESIKDSKKRQRVLRMQVGAIALGTAAGGLVGYVGADKIGDGANWLLDNTGAAGDAVRNTVSSAGDVISDVARDAKIVATYAPDAIATTAKNIDFRGSVDDDNSDAGGSEQASSTDTGSDAQPGATPVAGEQGGDSDASGAGTGGENVTDTGDTSTGEQPADLTDAPSAGENPADLTGDPTTEEQMAQSIAAAENAIDHEVFFNTIPVNPEDGVTDVLGRMLTDAGYENVTPGQLNTSYLEMIDKLGPRGIFEGVELQLSPDGSEYWIMGDVDQVTLTREASAWLENNFANVQDGVDISTDPIGPDNPDAYRGEAIGANPELITNITPVEYGDGVTQVLGRNLENAGYGSLSPEQLFTVYEGLIDHAGSDGVFEGVQLELQPNGEYWIMGDVTEVTLTPGAAEWIEGHLDTVNAETVNEVTETLQDVTDEHEPENQVIEQIQPTIHEVSEFTDFTIHEGDGVTQVLDRMYTSLGYDLTPEQLIDQYHDLVHGVGGEQIFEKPVEMYWDEAHENYRIAGDAPFEANFTPKAIEWLENNPPATEVSDVESLVDYRLELGNTQEALKNILASQGAANVPEGTLREFSTSLIKQAGVGNVFNNDSTEQLTMRVVGADPYLDANFTPTAAKIAKDMIAKAAEIEKAA